MMQRSLKQEITDEKVKEMVKEFIDHYAKNIDKGRNQLKVTFLKWAQSEKFQWLYVKQTRKTCS